MKGRNAMKRLNSFVLVPVVLVIAVQTGSIAQAQDYPTRPVS